MDPTEGHRSVRAALTAVADALTAHGFAAHTEARDGRLTIVSECCPFGETAQRVPARRVRARPRHDPRDARRPLRRDLTAVRDQPPRRRRPLRRPRLTRSLAWRAPTSTTRRRRRCDRSRSRRCSRTCASTTATRGGSTPRAAPRASRSRPRASRSRRCSAPGRARSCSPPAAPRRSTPRSGARSAPRAERGHVVTTAVEHSAVLDACARGATDGDASSASTASVASIPTRSPPRSDPTPCSSSVQLANHEVGTLQPAAAVVAAAAARRRRRSCTSTRARPPVTSPSTSPRSAPTSARSPRHKFGGPKGAAALLVRRGLRFPPFVVGGAQERARRGGIENVPAIVGFGAAALDARRRRLDARRASAALDRPARARDRSTRSPASSGSAIPTTRLPHLVCLGRRRRRGRADPARPRPARRRGALGLVVLERDARAVAGPRGDGRRRRPLAAGQRRAGRRPTPTSTRSSTRSPIVVGMRLAAACVGKLPRA